MNTDQTIIPLSFHIFASRLYNKRLFYCGMWDVEDCMMNLSLPVVNMFCSHQPQHAQHIIGLHQFLRFSPETEKMQFLSK